LWKARIGLVVAIVLFFVLCGVASSVYSSGSTAIQAVCTVPAPQSAVAQFTFPYKGKTYNTPFQITVGAWANSQKAWVTPDPKTPGNILAVTSTNPTTLSGVMALVAFVVLSVGIFQYWLISRHSSVAAIEGGLAVL
jgi:hypothetical protein